MTQRGKMRGDRREELREKESRKVSVLPCTKDFGDCLDCECVLRECDRLRRGKGAGKQREEISLVHRATPVYSDVG